MSMKQEDQAFDLEDILSELPDLTEAAPEDGELEDLVLGEELAQELESLDHLLEELPEVDLPVVELHLPGEAAEEPASLPLETIRMEEITKEALAQTVQEPQEIPEGATVRFQPVGEGAAAEATDDATQRFAPVEAPAAEEAAEAEEEKPAKEPIIFNPRAKLRELKKKLVAGPEKRYYELTEMGTGRLQLAILVNTVIVLLCAAVTTLFTMGMVPDNRLKLVVFSQVLAMLVSALLGSHQMLDGLAELLRFRFTINTLLSFSFLACMADAVFCLQEQRVPCCAAFCLQVTMALMARYHRRTTEIGQMDTLRKAVRLNGLVTVDDYFEGRDGLLRTEGKVEDFMDHYQKSSGPEKLQSVYVFLSLLICVGIAVFAYLLHGLRLAVQIFSTSLLVAVPASFFIATTRPMAILEHRLHMVGTVLCGWEGVKGLSQKLAFPLRDKDLFPKGSTKLNGVKFYGDRNPDEIVSCTTALITEAGGGLAPVFRELLVSRNCEEQTVTNFQNYGSGGIGGEVAGEPVLLGTLDFMQDMGVEIPQGTMVSQAVYASIDGQLCAVFAISYAKMRSAAAGMVTLCGYRKLTPVMICGDFMLTESFLRSKFEVRTRRIAFPSWEVREELKSIKPDEDEPVLAMTTRDELVSAAYAVTGAKALRTATRLGVAIHLIGGVLGMLIMLALAYLGSAELLTPTHVLLYQLVWLVPGMLITEWTRTV